MTTLPLRSTFLTIAEIEQIRELICREPRAAQIAEACVRLPAAQACRRPMVIPAPLEHGHRSYFDPATGAALLYDRQRPHEHRSPSGQVFHGPDYDRGWCDITHSFNANDARTCALSTALYGEAAAADLAKELLLRYASAYTTYPLVSRAKRLQGRLTASGLDEAVWSIGMLWAAELLWSCGQLKTADVALVRNALFVPLVELLRQQWREIHNIRSWINAAIGSAGLAFGLEDVAREAIDGPHGWHRQLHEGYRADGLSFEGSPGYHAYGMGAMLFLAEAMARHGREPYAEPLLLRACQAPLRLTQPDYTLPALNDYSRQAPLPTRLYGTALRRWPSDGLIAAGAAEAMRLWRANGFGPDTSCGEWNHTPAYYARQQTDWLLAWEHLNPSLRLSPEPVTCFADSGVGIIRPARRDLALLKCTRVGGSGHDHRDQLHLCWWHAGVCWLDDVGSGDYADPLHADWFAQTLAHNTVTVNRVTHERCDAHLLLCEPWRLIGQARPYPNSMPDVRLRRESTVERGGALNDCLIAESDVDRCFDYVLRPFGRLHVPAGASVSDYGPLGESSTYDRMRCIGLGYETPRNVRRVRFENGGVTPLRWQQAGASMELAVLTPQDQIEILIADAPLAPRRNTDLGQMLILRYHGRRIDFRVALTSRLRTVVEKLPRAAHRPAPAL